MTPAELAALKAAIDADPTLSALPRDPDGNFAIAAAFNLPASPDYWVWRTNVTRKEAVETTSTDADGVTSRSFNWTGAGFIGRSQGERDAWRELWNHSGQVNAALPSVRQAFLDIFSGPTAPAPSNRQHLSNVSRRLATRGEKLYAQGTGTAASPATMTLEGSISAQDIETARNLP